MIFILLLILSITMSTFSMNQDRNETRELTPEEIRKRQLHEEFLNSRNSQGQTPWQAYFATVDPEDPPHNYLEMMDQLWTPKSDE